MKIAIIGTAGRGEDFCRLTTFRYNRMISWCQEKITDLRHKGVEDIELVSGGAAWADHLAVLMFKRQIVDRLTLHLPAPFTDRFDILSDAGRSANFYHEQFSTKLNGNSFENLVEVIESPYCRVTEQPVAKGFGPFFARNALVVKELDPEKDAMYAFTFGPDHEPKDGGTKHTWDLFKSSRKRHIALGNI